MEVYSPQIIKELYAAHPILTLSLGGLAFAGFLGRHLQIARGVQKRFPVSFALVELVGASGAFIFLYILVCLFLQLFPAAAASAWPSALFLFLLVILISWYVARVIHTLVNLRYIETSGSSVQRVSGLVRGMIYTICLLTGVTAFLAIRGYSFTGVWVSTGLLTALLGFALQQTLSDFFSGLALSLEGPFRIGDRIRLDQGTEGEVVDINWRATRLHDWDNTVHVIPNSKLAKQGFINLGNEYSYYHPWYFIQLPAEIDPRFAKELILEGIYRCKHVLKRPPPVVRLTDASTIPYTYMFWIYFKNYASLFRGREELYREIHYVLQRAGVTPAASTQEWRGRKSIAPTVEVPTLELALKSQKIFSELPHEEILKITQVSQQLHYDADSTIELEQGITDALDVIVSGIVEVFMELPDGKRVSTGELGPGENFGLISMFTEKPNTFIRVAQTDVSLIRIDFECMQKLIRDHPNLSDQVAAIVRQRQDEAEYMLQTEAAAPAPSSLSEIKRYIRRITGKENMKL